MFPLRKPHPSAINQQQFDINFHVEAVYILSEEGVPNFIFRLQGDERFLWLKSRELLELGEFRRSFLECYYQIPELPVSKTSWEVIVNRWLSFARLVHDEHDIYRLSGLIPDQKGAQTHG